MENADLVQMPGDYLHAPDATASQLRHLPGDFGPPVLGKTAALFRDFYGTVSNCYDKYGAVSKINIGFRPGVLVLGPDPFKQVLVDPERKFSSRMGYDTLSPWFGGALLLRDFDEHRMHRRVFQAAFKADAMRGYVTMIDAILERHLDKWGEQREFPAVPKIQLLLMSVAAEVFYGIKGLDEAESERLGNAFRRVVTDGPQALVRVNLPPFKWYYGQRAKSYLSRYIGSMISQRRASSGADFMSYLVQAKTDKGEYLTDQELIDHLMFMFFAAYDTTTTALSHVLMHLAVDAPLQERLREQCLAMGKARLGYDDLGGMESVENTVDESLRLYPSVSIMSRRTIRECGIGGQRIPKNTVLFLVPMFNHRMAAWWEHPERFDPERFAAPRQEHKRHPYIFAPFGGGAHKCIGMHFAYMNSKLFMHKLLTRYRFRACAGYVPKSRTLPLPQPVRGLPIILEPLVQRRA